MAGTRHFAGLGAAMLFVLVLVTGCGSGEGAAGSDPSGTAPASEGAKAEPGTAGGGDQGGDTRADGRDEAATQRDTEAAGGSDAIAAGLPEPGGVELDPLAFAGRDVVFTA